jgi:hypothetical protein
MTLLQGARSSARANKSGMTAEYALSCHCDELMYSVDESENLDVTTNNVS